jgi:hypothetical protein
MSLDRFNPLGRQGDIFSNVAGYGLAGGAYSGCADAW